jgi:hypothetical protein
MKPAQEFEAAVAEKLDARTRLIAGGVRDESWLPTQCKILLEPEPKILIQESRKPDPPKLVIPPEPQWTKSVGLFPHEMRWNAYAIYLDIHTEDDGDYVFIVDQGVWDDALRPLWLNDPRPYDVRKGRVYLHKDSDLDLCAVVTGVRDAQLLHTFSRVIDYRAANLTWAGKSTSPIRLADMTEVEQKNYEAPDSKVYFRDRKVYLGHRELLLAEPVLDEFGRETDATIIDGHPSMTQHSPNEDDIISKMEDKERVQALEQLKQESPADYAWFVEYMGRTRPSPLVDRQRAYTIRRRMKASNPAAFGENGRKERSDKKPTSATTYGEC